MAVKRIIVVGCGSIGRRHARLLSQRADLQVELCDANEFALQTSARETHAAATWTDFDQMLATRPYAVVIATPHHLHAQQSIAALQASVHVLCEKPMSESLESARQMLQAAEKSDRVLSIGFHMHFHPGLRRVKELIDSGALGTIAHAHCWVGTYITLRNSVSRHQMSVEGALLLDYAHQPDTLHWMLGKVPKRIYMSALQTGSMELSSNPNVALMNLEFDEPLLATIHLNYMQMPERNGFEFVGDKGWLIYDVKAGQIRVGNLAGDSERTETVSAERDPVYIAEHDRFLASCEGKLKPESPAHDAIVAMRVIDAALTSWRSAQPAPIRD